MFPSHRQRLSHLLFVQDRQARLQSRRLSRKVPAGSSCCYLRFLLYATLNRSQPSPLGLLALSTFFFLSLALSRRDIFFHGYHCKTTKAPEKGHARTCCSVCHHPHLCRISCGSLMHRLLHLIKLQTSICMDSWSTRLPDILSCHAQCALTWRPSARPFRRIPSFTPNEWRSPHGSSSRPYTPTAVWTHGTWSLKSYTSVVVRKEASYSSKPPRLPQCRASLGGFISTFRLSFAHQDSILNLLVD